MTNWRRLLRFVSALGIGAGLGVGLWALIVTAIEPPPTWLRVYVSSECPIAARAIADAEQAEPPLMVIVLPLDTQTAKLVCPRGDVEGLRAVFAAAATKNALHR